MSILDPEALLHQYNESLSHVLPKAVGTNLVLWSSVSLGTVLLFNILRPRNKVVYEPKSKYHVGDKKPPSIDNGFFSWVSPLVHVKEPVLLDKLGLDAVAFLRFLRMMRWIFLAVSVLSCAILIPINVSYNLKFIPEGERDVLGMLTIQKLSGEWLFAHVAMSYVINGIVLAFIYFNWKAMAVLRLSWFRSDEYQKSFYARTLMVLGVPRKMQNDKGIAQLFASLQVPYPATSVHIGRRVGQLPELIEYHNNTVRELEQVLVRYLKGGKPGKKRPTIRIGGFMGLGGETKDAIEWYTRKLARTEAAVKEWREKSEVNKVENYGFASMAAVPYAHIVAQRLAGKHPKGTTITLAPNPRDIIWKNLTMSDSTRARQQLMGWLWLALVCFFNTIPLLIISLLANLSSVAQYVPFLQEWQNSSEWSFALVNGILPPTVSSIFGWILPKIMRWLSEYQGAITQTRLDRAVVQRYFAFLIISQLFIFSLLGVLLNLVKVTYFNIAQHKSFMEIIKNIQVDPNDILGSYISQAPYWLTFFPLRGFLAIFDLAQLINLVVIWVKTRLFGRTPRDIREWTQPPEFEYAIYYSNLLFMAAVGLVYAPLAPLVALAAAVVFWISSIVYKYQLMFVFVSRVESGGRLWNIVCNRLLACLIFMQLIVTLTIGLAMGWTSYYWVSGVPPLFAVLICKVWWDRTFHPRFTYYIPRDKEMAEVIVHSQRADNQGNRLEKRFGHPALQSDLFTPMLHAKMMPLLAQVYQGRLGHDTAMMGEYGGQKMEAQIAPGGVRIAAIEQSDLEYDPALYRRDRGEADWETQSISSSARMDIKSVNYSPSAKQAPVGYEQYLQHGPQQGVYELNRLDTSDLNVPLLAARSQTNLPYERSGTPGHERSSSVAPGATPYGRAVTPQLGTPSSYFPPQQQQQYPPQGQYATPTRSQSSLGYHQHSPSGGPNEYGAYAAPVPQYAQSPQRSGSPSGYHHQSSPSMGGRPPQHQQSPSYSSGGGGGGEPNMAGRGAYRQNY